MVVLPTADFWTDGRLRKRKSGLTKADDFKNAKKVVSFDVQLEDSVVTDFNKEDAYQSCAVFSPDGSLLATAGADGHIRMWKVWISLPSCIITLTAAVICIVIYMYVKP